MPTACAGLLFLLPLMQRLGIETLLRAHPHLVEINFPERLLSTLAARLGVLEDDPIRLAWNAPSLYRSAPLTWTAPASWANLCGEGPWTIHRVGPAGRRLILDPSGRLALARWRDAAPEGVGALTTGHPLRRGAPLPAEDDLNLLLCSWRIAMRRWCRRYTDMGLRDVVHRPGRILATRTHVDLLFDHRQTDIRVRKAGLDLDPGWLPWLGRVVSFHYRYGEDADGSR